VGWVASPSPWLLWLVIVMTAALVPRVSDVQNVATISLPPLVLLVLPGLADIQMGCTAAAPRGAPTTSYRDHSYRWCHHHHHHHHHHLRRAVQWLVLWGPVETAVETASAFSRG